jgi:hypothetical protein
VNPSQKPYPRPQGLSGYLERMPQLRPALAQARMSMRSEQSLKECLPPRIAHQVHSIHSTGMALVICVTSAEAAHMLRLERPEIEAAIAAKGLKFNEILLTVQTKSAAPQTRRTLPARVSVDQMSQGLGQIKSERLQTSLGRLVETLKNK